MEKRDLNVWVDKNMRGTTTIKPVLLAAATSLFMGGLANAGGAIGGDCCADLEERVAELEATTARKGNRKVSLKIYGQVNKAVVFVDHLFPIQSPQIVNNPLSHTNFGLEGSARISSDLYVGYNIEFDVTHNTGNPLELTRNELYIGSKTLGKLSIGHGAMAADGIAEIDLSGTTVAGGSDNVGGAFTPAIEMLNLDGVEAERVRYDSPLIAGFVVSAAWTENDDFDVAIRYGAKLGQFKVAAGIAYQDVDVFPAPFDQTILSGSVSALHEPSGLSLTVAGGKLEYDGDGIVDMFYVKAGLQRRFFSAGDTALSVDYHIISNPNGPQEAEKLGFQLVQNIDAAAMELYLSAWSTETNLAAPSEEDGLMIGSRIRF